MAAATQIDIDPSLYAPTRIPKDMPDADAVETMVIRAGTSFHSAMKMLPVERRAAMYALYAFCREVDDIADEPGTPEEKEAGLAYWRAEIAAVFGGEPPHSSIGRELALARPRFDLEPQPFLDIIDGMAMDAHDPIQAPSAAELDLYCARVAGAVGHVSVRAFGTPREAGKKIADAQGRALQLTNILRDIAEDAERDRLYLPRETLVANGITSTKPQDVLAHPNLPLVCAEVARQARGYFKEALDTMNTCPRKTVRPARVMLEMYRRILDQMEARGWEKFREPVSLPKMTKIWVALRYGLI